MTNAFLITDDDIIICDPEAEYYPLVQRLQGQVIRLSPTSPHYVNPMDINLNYSEDDNPLALKSDFILSLCELIVGGKQRIKKQYAKTVKAQGAKTVKNAAENTRKAAKKTAEGTKKTIAFTLLAYANKKIEELDTRRQKITKAIADLSVETISQQQIDLLSGYLDDWENISFEDKRKATDGLISSISATSEYVKIEWKI